VPLAAVVTAGQAHESKSFEKVMESVPRPRRVGWPTRVAGDKGYSYPSVATWLANREIVSVIPQRSDQIKRNGKAPLDRRAYRRRSVVERCVCWLKENRRLGTRYDKLAAGFMGFVTLAFIRRYLRLLHPSDTP
jgi:transposase